MASVPDEQALETVNAGPESEYLRRIHSAGEPAMKSFNGFAGAVPDDRSSA
jgi:hypothetical protein